MKKIIIALICLAGIQQVNAQEKTDSLPAYERIPTAPPFNIMTVPDSLAFSKADLKSKKPLIIIVFSPDCDHCKHFTKQMLAKYDEIKKAQIVMSSVLPYDLIKKFYEEDKIADYPNITMGRDANNFIGTFFSVRSFPTIIVYNKKGKFVKKFDGSVNIEKLAEALKN